jgi:mannose-6-phosphate isomerase
VQGTRFPLLFKLLDTMGGLPLSIQVHPNDAQARRLAGENELGKTEAWYIVDAEPGAELVLGLKPGTTQAEFNAALGDTERLQGILLHHQVRPGDYFFVPAGTVHAVGKGLLIAELQQTSDTTYRLDDLGRLDKDGKPRKLHIYEGRQVTRVDAPAEKRLLSPRVEVGEESEPFKTELVQGGAEPVAFDTRGQSFHIFTVLEGWARLEGRGWQQILGPQETAVLGANLGQYTGRSLLGEKGAPGGTFKALKGTANR